MTFLRHWIRALILKLNDVQTSSFLLHSFNMYTYVYAYGDHAYVIMNRHNYTYACVHVTMHM